MCKENQKINVILCKPEKEAKAVEIENTLTALQEVVGGLIQVIYPFSEEVGIVCCDEGKLLGMPLNRGLKDENGNLYDIICGDFLIVGLGEDDFCSLSPELMEKYLDFFKYPEIFIRSNGKIVCIEEL